MPLYEYKCHKCGQHLERIQKFSDDPLTIHDDCGGELERLVSAPALQFKGTGWYVTDYGRKGNSPASGSNGKSESKSESSSSESKSDSTKTESKPASSNSTTSTDTKSS